MNGVKHQPWWRRSVTVTPAAATLIGLAIGSVFGGLSGVPGRGLGIHPVALERPGQRGAVPEDGGLGRIGRDRRTPRSLSGLLDRLDESRSGSIRSRSLPGPSRMHSTTNLESGAIASPVLDGLLVNSRHNSLTPSFRIVPRSTVCAKINLVAMRGWGPVTGIHRIT